MAKLRAAQSCLFASHANLFGGLHAEVFAHRGMSPGIPVPHRALHHRRLSNPSFRAQKTRKNAPFYAPFLEKTPPIAGHFAKKIYVHNPAFFCDSTRPQEFVDL